MLIDLPPTKFDYVVWIAAMIFIGWCLHDIIPNMIAYGCVMR